MGYVFVTGTCGACGRMFSFNPNYVPSINNVPFCRSCIESANFIRKEKGIEPFVIHPQAYEVLPEEELRY